MKKILGIIVLGFLWCNTAAALPKCIGEDISKWTMCEGTFLFESGRKYIGEWKDSKPHGQGALTYADGSQTYVGDWRGGLRHGQGTFTYLDGRKYIGEWIKSEHHGQGTSTEINGKKYIGQFRNDKFIKQ